MQFCCTDVPIHTFEYYWTIKKFGLQLKLSEQHKNDITLKSAPCLVGDWNYKIKWYFQLNIHGNESNHKEFIGIAALSDAAEESISGIEIRSWHKYYFLNSHNERIQIHNSLDSLSVCSWECNEFYHKKSLLDEAELFLINDQLTIICQINVMGEPITTDENRITETIETTNNISNDIAKLFITKKYADVTFVLNNNMKIKAHKTILMARSAVFADMINDQQRKLQEMKDHNDNDFIIELKDFFSVTFIEILRYIYTDKVKKLEDMEVCLLSASYEYQLEGLKSMCVDSLCKTLTVDCAMSTLEMAVRYQCKKLIDFTENFIFSQMPDVVCTDEFQCMLTHNPELVEKLLAKDN